MSQRKNISNKGKPDKDKPDVGNIKPKPIEPEPIKPIPEKPVKVDLAKCSIEELVSLLKRKKYKLEDIPFKRIAQVNAFKIKEKPKPDLSKETVSNLKQRVGAKEKQLTEIPLQKRIQLQRKLELEEEARRIQELFPDG